MRAVQAQRPSVSHLFDAVKHGAVTGGELGVLQALREQGREAGWLDASTPCGGYARPFDPRWSVVLLDEVDAYGPEQQHTAFNWFIHAMTPQQGEPCWVLSAGRLPVTDLPLREDLRTRLGWGQVFGLQPLAEDDVQRALRQEAQARGLDLSDEVLRYMLSRFSRDLGSLSQLLAMLDDYALETRRAITVPLLISLFLTGATRPLPGSVGAVVDPADADREP